MAYLPTSSLALDYKNFAGYWGKAYVTNTTTPKTISLDSNGTTFASKLQLNNDGFFVTDGNAIVIPYLEGFFDFWLFPTKAEAEANDTTNAVRIADGTQGEEGSTINETIPLLDGQTTVTFSQVRAETAVIYLQGRNVDRGKLLNTIDYTITSGSVIELKSSYPANTIIEARGFTNITSGAVISVHGRTGVVTAAPNDYSSNQISFDNTISGLSATEVKGAIDEVNAKTVTNASNISLNDGKIKSNKIFGLAGMIL